MKRPDFNRIVNRLDGLTTGFSGKLKVTRQDVDEVIPQLTQAMIDHNAREVIFRNDDVALPELKDAVKKVIYVYSHYEWPVDGLLSSLLTWTLHSGSKTRRSQQKDKSPMPIGAFLEALHLKVKGKPIARAKLAQLVSVSPTTVGRWRERADYQDMINEPIDNPEIINRADEYFSGKRRITAAISIKFGKSDETELPPVSCEIERLGKPTKVYSV
ncbi:MAG: hypothetical protein R3F37_02220 [Candidatus Competibacteraceae bacterium]